MGVVENAEHRGRRSDPRFAPFLAHWKNSGALQSRVYDARLRASLKSVAHNRYCIVHAANAQDLRVSGIGDGFLAAVRDALLPSVGRKFSEIADPQFASFCEAAYKTAAERSAPVLEHIDSYIKTPGRRTLRRRYARLILPMQSEDGSMCLLGISFEDDGIDLRSRVS